MKDLYAKYRETLVELEQNAQKRKLVNFSKADKFIICDGKRYLNLSSNDYLGIAENKKILKSFMKIGEFSLGSASSRLLTGSGAVYSKLECLVSSLFRKDKALVFNSGYHANVGIMSSLLSKKDVVFSDKLNHASILDGVKLSEAKMFRYKHLDYEHLEELLEKHRGEYETAIIATESVFSMDGDIADLNKLVELKKKYNAILMVDEAHAFGVFGEKGLGICEVQNCKKDIDLIVATFGKAIGSVGAFCTGDKVLIDYLVNKARPLIFSTSIPEMNIAFSYYILTEVLPNMAKERKNLLITAEKLREEIKKAGLETSGESHIVPVILGSNERAVECSKNMMDNGYYLLPIRHPTVALNSSRIRISLRADINFEEIEKIPELTKNLAIS